MFKKTTVFEWAIIFVQGIVEKYFFGIKSEHDEVCYEPKNSMHCTSVLFL